MKILVIHLQNPFALSLSTNQPFVLSFVEGCGWFAQVEGLQIGRGEVRVLAMVKPEKQNHD